MLHLVVSFFPPFNLLQPGKIMHGLEKKLSCKAKRKKEGYTYTPLGMEGIRNLSAAWNLLSSLSFALLVNFAVCGEERRMVGPRWKERESSKVLKPPSRKEWRIQNWEKNGTWSIRMLQERTMHNKGILSSLFDYIVSLRLLLGLCQATPILRQPLPSPCSAALKLIVVNDIEINILLDPWSLGY